MNKNQTILFKTGGILICSIVSYLYGETIRNYLLSLVPFSWSVLYFIIAIIFILLLTDNTFFDIIHDKSQLWGKVFRIVVIIYCAPGLIIFGTFIFGFLTAITISIILFIVSIFLGLLNLFYSLH
jgi:uncharacterized membrane protein YeiH